MATPGFRTFSPALQRFLIATVVNMVGTAMLFGFVLIYLHEVRGISLGRAGFAVGATSFATVVFTPLGGWLSDHLGARRILTSGCVLAIVAGSAYAFVDTFVEALLAGLLLGAANALWFPSQSALLSLIVDSSRRPAVMAFQRAALNLGAALGGVVGGFIVVSQSSASFMWLIGVNVATYVVFLAALPGMPSGRVERDRTTHQPGFRAVLTDGFFLRLLATDVSIALGFGFLFAFMPAYASGIGIGNGTIGVLFMLGAISVVLTQIPTLRWVSGRPRMESLARMNLWFAGAFALMVLTPHVGVALAVTFIAIGQVLGGFGESVLGAVRQPLTSDLAPPELVGRYFGLATMVFQGCMGAATAIGGGVMARSASLVWWIPLIASLVGVAGTLALRHRIPAHVAVSA
jgi:MFS family permease